MIIGVDIGGTKILVGRLDSRTDIVQSHQFPTPIKSEEALSAIVEHIKKLPDWENAQMVVVGAPGFISLHTRLVKDFGNLPWENVDIIHTLQTDLGLPVVVENDANLAGLSEVRLQNLGKGTTLYLTVSTGIGSAVLNDNKLDPALIQSEAGQMMLRLGEDYEVWEKFASGHALYDLYHKKAEVIEDDAIWYRVSEALVVGILPLLAILQPTSIIIGGSVGTYFERYAQHIKDLLIQENESSLVAIPKLYAARNAEKAVLFGCYEYAQDQLAKT